MTYGHTVYLKNEEHITVSGCETPYIAFRRSYLMAKDCGLKLRNLFGDSKIMRKKDVIKKYKEFKSGR